MDTSMLILLLISRIPLYVFVVYKAWQYRKTTIIISAFWLGVLSATAIAAATASVFGPPLIRGLMGQVIAISMFMLALTARPATIKIKTKR